MAKDELAGKRVKCPGCGGVLTIPQPQQSQVDLGLNAAPMQSPAQAAPQAFGNTANMPHTAAPAGWQGQPSWQSAAYPQQKKGGMSKGLIIGLVVGGGVLLVGLLGIVIAVMMLMPASGDNSVANTTPSSSSGTSITSVETNSNASGTETTGGTSNGTNASPTTSLPVATEPTTTTSELPATNPDSTNPNSTSPAPTIAPDNSSSNSNPSQPAGPIVQPADTSLASSAIQWHGQSGANLRGARRIDDDELVILHYSWMCELLPFIGHQDVYDKFNFQRTWMGEPNQVIATAIIPEFLNPHDTREKRWAGLGYQRGMGLTHFAGMSGLETRNEVAAKLPRSDPKAGMFGYDEIAKASQITDGTSQTIMIIGTGEFASPWVQAGGGTIRGAREPLFDEITGLGSKGLAKKGSFAVMADGSIRFISADIDPRVFRAMCTIHGGENIDESTIGPALQGFSLP